METFYIVILAFLACLAVFDLFVGVSNDAVNFLNSALGCRIASFKTTMIVTSLGVLLGATFSSGMMEVARSGVFHPQMFSFNEIMIIFFAVMVTDIILLDAFNSLGLPTSTTVSIVFELLGSAIAASAYKLLSDDASLGMVIDYINSSKALTIISGILISVVIAFITGAVVQYIARLIFTFHFERVYRRIGGIYGSFAITSIIYFLLFKGAKGASFMRPEWLAFLKENTWCILGTLFVLFAIAFQLSITYFKANIFKTIILAGTFSLAFAFAGNDLVNFVGVPLAAYESWQEWGASGVAAEVLTMESLLKPTATPTIFLLLSGLIMVLTLWFSKKAHRVIQTSINLSSTQAGEHEQFGSSLPGRLIVRASLNMANILNQILPNSLQKSLNNRFKPKETVDGEEILPFDYVRASINLMVSAILIASATSLKLPLSTTYVTFMVAMGSSFADGAWNRETAVYRISGILTVISGWFITAFSACALACIVCTAVLYGGPWIAVLLGLASISLIIWSNLRKEPDLTPLSKLEDNRYNASEINAMMNEKSPIIVHSTLDAFAEIIEGFLNDDEFRLRKAQRKCNDLFDAIHRDRGLYYNMANAYAKPSKSDNDSRYCYYRALTDMQEVARSLQRLALLTKDHVANCHRVYDGQLRQELLALKDMLIDAAGGENHSLDKLHAESADMRTHIEDLLAKFLRSIPEEGLSMHGCEIYLNCIFFIRELLSHYEVVYVLMARIKTLSMHPQMDTPESLPTQISAGTATLHARTCICDKVNHIDHVDYSSLR